MSSYIHQKIHFGESGGRPLTGGVGPLPPLEPSMDATSSEGFLLAETAYLLTWTVWTCKRVWQVDGLANSVGANYKLNDGAIARSILEAAGPDIQQELNSVKPRGAPRAGDIVVTRGHRLRASCVFHGVLKKWNNGQDDAEAVSQGSFTLDPARHSIRHGVVRFCVPCRAVKEP